MNSEDARHKSFPLRLPPSLRQQSTELARNEGISLNHFISLAIAEKVSRMHISDEGVREQARPALALVARKPVTENPGA
ncbi:MAG: toxin-antitoxin system HicB family antitoxin [Acidobacteriaceae bacterium]|nr:toxin-antitoxin system HicB family antitoxin [Acidobacteriaceae bacterium]